MLGGQFKRPHELKGLRACEHARETGEEEREAERSAAWRRELWREIGGEGGAGECSVPGEIVIGGDRDAQERGGEGGEQRREHEQRQSTGQPDSVVAHHAEGRKGCRPDHLLRAEWDPASQRVGGAKAERVADRLRKAERIEGRVGREGQEEGQPDRLAQLGARGGAQSYVHARAATGRAGSSGTHQHVRIG
jgi:hypothetical protein